MFTRVRPPSAQTPLLPHPRLSLPPLYNGFRSPCVLENKGRQTIRSLWSWTYSGQHSRIRCVCLNCVSLLVSNPCRAYTGAYDLLGVKYDPLATQGIPPHIHPGASTNSRPSHSCPNTPPPAPPPFPPKQAPPKARPTTCTSTGAGGADTAVEARDNNLWLWSTPTSGSALSPQSRARSRSLEPLLLVRCGLLEPLLDPTLPTRSRSEQRA